MLACVFTEAARTQGGEPSQMSSVRDFNIPGQPLAQALQAYSQVTGVEVLYESNIAVAQRSLPVEGSLTPQRALQTLLAGTDLVVRYTRSNAVILSLPDLNLNLPPLHPLGDADLALETLRVTGGQGVVDPDRLREFKEAVQIDIEAALRKNAQTSSGSYRASLNLWVESSRAISRAELTQSTGDQGRDLSIAETLKGLILKRVPPVNTPQPIRVVILVRSL